MNQHLDVGFGAKAMALLLQFTSQREVIEDLAIATEDQRSILVEQRLITRFEIDYFQAPRPHARVWLDKVTAWIRPAVHERARHGVEDAFFNAPGAMEIDVTNYPAH